MNTKSDSDEASRGSEASSSKNTTPSDNNPEEESTSDLCPTTVPSRTEDTMKRAAAKQLLERYFYQLVDGCGNPNCDNQYCASSGEARNLSPNEAAAEAIILFSKEARLCEALPNKVPRTESNECESSASTTCTTSHAKDITESQSNEESPNFSKESTSKEEPEASQNVSRKEDSKTHNHSNGDPLTEERISELCDECLSSQVKTPLIRALGEAFTQPAILARCFARKVTEQSNHEEDRRNIDKESKEMCTTSDPDKDVDSVTGPELDVAACKRAFKYLSKLPPDYYSPALVSSLKTLADTLVIDLRVVKKLSIEEIVNCFVIAFEVPDLGSSDYLEIALPALCNAAEYLPLKAQAKLARTWATHCKDSLRHILETLQQLITLRVISTNYSRHYQLQDDRNLTTATKLMKIVYYANMAGGVMEASGREEPISLPSNQDPLDDVLGHLYPGAGKAARDAAPDDPLGGHTTTTHYTG